MKVILATIFIVFSNLLYSQDSIVYWKRYTSIDYVSGGPLIYGVEKNKYYSGGVFNFNLGFTKREKTPFLNIGANFKYNYPVFSIWPDPNQNSWSELTVHLGVFFLKKKRIEGTVSTGFSHIEKLNYVSTSKLRLVYKITKYFGIGSELYVNINHHEDYAALRLSIHFSNGL